LQCQIKTIKIMKNKAAYHHSAMKRGYIRVCDDCKHEDYEGKYGKGYIVHHANLRCGRKSTYYHVIDYYIILS